MMLKRIMFIKYVRYSLYLISINKLYISICIDI